MIQHKLSREEKEQFINKLTSLGAGVDFDSEEIENDFPQYLLYNKTGKYAYCTRCHQFFDISRKFCASIKHKEHNICPSCQDGVTTLAEGRGRGGIENFRPYMQVCRLNEDEIVLIGVDVKSEFAYKNCTILFNREEGDLEYSFSRECFYYLSKDGEVRRFKYQIVWDPDRYGYTYEWVEMNDREVNPSFWIHEYCTYYARGSTKEFLIKNSDIEKLRNSFLKYAVKSWEEHFDNFSFGFIRYLTLYTMHPNVEFLMNGGYSFVVRERCQDIATGIRINWRSNNLKKMLGLNSYEIKLLADQESCIDIKKYKYFKDKIQGFKPNDFETLKRYDFETLSEVQNLSKLKPRAIVDYCKDNHELTLYRDYLRMAIDLEYDIRDTQILKPKNLVEMHNRCSGLIKTMSNEILSKKYKSRYKKLQNKYCFRDEETGLMIVIPRGAEDIKNEGKILHHCVGGYAERHLNGTTTILFIRKIRKPLTPFYTMEINDKDFRIRQVYGYKDNVGFKKAKLVIDFVKNFKDYLKEKTGREVTIA